MKPLDLEELADEIIRVIYPTYDKTEKHIQEAIRRKRNLIKLILRQHIEKADLHLKTF